MVLKKKNKKNFLQKINLNRTLSKIQVLNQSLKLRETNMFVSNNLYIKTNLYKFVKNFLNFKILLSNPEVAKDLSMKLQYSNLYTSAIEIEKKNQILRLRSFLLSQSFLRKLCVQGLQIFHKNQDLHTLNFQALKKSFAIYNRIFSFSKSFQSYAIVHFLKVKRFYNIIKDKRFTAKLITYRKKYSLRSASVFNNRLRLYCFLRLYSRTFLKYLKVKFLYKKKYRRLNKRWRMRTRRKWKQSRFFRFYRSRNRLYHKFYVPKHLEINYKTLSFVYHDFTSISSINTKFTFWLNLRRMYTFLIR